MRLTAFALCALLSGSAACSDPQETQLAGKYIRHHRIYVFHGSEPVEVQAEDHLTLEPLGQRELRFALELTASDGKECAISGVAKVRRRGLGYHDTSGADDCRLEFRTLGNGITVEDVEDACRKRYCAEFVSIGRQTFSPAGASSADPS